MRGENTIAFDWVAFTSGSSPHARGKHGGDLRIAGGSRLIPACAGKTRWRFTYRRWLKAHPRMRGENTKTMRFTFTADGSSPHARGKRIHILLVRSMVRLIPACAGKTSQPISKVCTAGAHPRMHGENSRGCRKNAPSGGSSPHARGKPRFASAVPWIRRLIPACAGKTHARDVEPVGTGAHPRMRGENTPLKTEST